MESRYDRDKSRVAYQMHVEPVGEKALLIEFANFVGCSNIS